MKTIMYTHEPFKLVKQLILLLVLAAYLTAMSACVLAEDETADDAITRLVASWVEKYADDVNWSMQGNPTIYPCASFPDDQDLPKEQAVYTAVKAVLAITGNNAAWMENMVPQLFFYDQNEPGRHWVVLFRPEIGSLLYGEELNAYHVTLDQDGRLYTLTIHTAGKSI